MKLSTAVGFFSNVVVCVINMNTFYDHSEQFSFVLLYCTFLTFYSWILHAYFIPSKRLRMLFVYCIFIFFQEISTESVHILQVIIENTVIISEFWVTRCVSPYISKIKNHKWFSQNKITSIYLVLECMFKYELC